MPPRLAWSLELSGNFFLFLVCFKFRHQMEYCSAIRKNEILSFSATWIDLEDIILSEISQQRETLYDNTYT